MTRSVPRALLALAAGSGGCVSLEEPSASVPLTWTADVAPLLDRACRSCHGGDPDDAAPDLRTYRGLFECGPGGRFAAPGDPASRLLSVLDRPDHAGLLTEGERARLVGYVVGDQLTYASPLGHPAGWAAPGSAAFHGDALRAAGFADATTVDGCQKCHGTVAVPCADCHAGGFAEDRCGGCHGSAADPRPSPSACAPAERRAAAGAHAAHGDVEKAHFPRVACATCHAVPTQVSASGHLDPGPADVRFDAGALPGASYEPATRTCSVPACHLDRPMAWASTASAADPCARCHGNPPDGHASSACETCHAGAFDLATGPDPARHLDGVVQLAEACDGCHGNPPGRTFGGPPGAHLAHVEAGRFAAPVACESCHVVPASRDAPGHLDSPLPAEVRLAGDRATAAGRLTPSYDPATRTCADVGCHGGHLDGATAPAWDQPPVECGGCHGLPPARLGSGEAHLPTGEAACGFCHRTPEGEPITVGTASIARAGRARHIDGCVDLGRGCTP